MVNFTIATIPCAADTVHYINSRVAVTAMITTTLSLLTSTAWETRSIEQSLQAYTRLCQQIQSPGPPALILTALPVTILAIVPLLELKSQAATTASTITTLTTWALRVDARTTQGTPYGANRTTWIAGIDHTAVLANPALFKSEMVPGTLPPALILMVDQPLLS